jgi:peroxiredoxin
VPLSQRALTWLLGGFAAFFALLTLGAVWLAHAPSTPNPAAGADHPPAEALRVGMAAPEFSLPDELDRERGLTDLDGKPAVLLFLCGCSRCYLMVHALQATEKGLGGEKPRHMVVTTMTPSEARSWQERTGFHALFLFEKSSHGPVISQYAGHPCPRVYVLDGRRSIRYISPSPEGNADPERVMADLAAALRGASTAGADLPRASR